MTYICSTKGCSNTRCTKMYNISQFFTSTPHLTYFLQHLNSTLWRRKLWSQTKQNCLKWEENPENILKGEREYNTRQESSIDLNDASIKMNISINWSSAAFLELWEKGESYLATSSMVAGIGLSFVSARKHISIYIEHRQQSCFYLRVRYMVSPGRINVMSPEVIAMDPKMRVGMIGLISAKAATVVDRVPPTLSEKKHG